MSYDRAKTIARLPAVLAVTKDLTALEQGYIAVALLRTLSQQDVASGDAFDRAHIAAHLHAVAHALTYGEILPNDAVDRRFLELADATLRLVRT